MAKKKELEAKRKAAAAAVKEDDPIKRLEDDLKNDDRKKAKNQIDYDDQDQTDQDQIDQNDDSDEPVDCNDYHCDDDYYYGDSYSVQPDDTAATDSDNDDDDDGAVHKAGFIPSIDTLKKNGPGKAYKYWDYTNRIWIITQNFWVAKQASDLWDVVWLWYENGRIKRPLTKDEMIRYLP